MSEPKQFTAWITKYALTRGIFKVQARVCEAVSLDMIEVVGRPQEYHHGRDWHRTPEAAVSRAEEMKGTKINTLKKTLAKVQAMKFEAP